MPSTTSSHHHTADLELSPAGALRALRGIAYREWEVYRPPAATLETGERSEYSVDPEFSFDSDASFVGEPDESEEYAPTPVIDLTDGSGDWYLNEVPAEWIEDSRSDEQPSTPLPA